MSFSNVVVVGNLGKKPECRYNGKQTAFAYLSVATTKKWTDRDTGQLQEKTDWVPVLTQGKMAENAAEYLDKGQEVRVIGELATKVKEENGQRRTELYVKCTHLEFGPKPHGAGQSTDQRPSQSSASNRPEGGNGGRGNNGQGAGSSHRSSGQQSQQRPPAQNFDDFEDDIPF